MLNVALLAEGVDRNALYDQRCHTGRPVALLAEGVDRNLTTAMNAQTNQMSPSSRRAWIEILVAREVKRAALVALLAEGVDRNLVPVLGISQMPPVALLAEGVDRNRLLAVI